MDGVTHHKPTHNKGAKTPLFRTPLMVKMAPKRRFLRLPKFLGNRARDFRTFWGCLVFIAMSAMLTPPMHGAGFVFNDNFTVLTPAVPSQQAADVYAAGLLQKAERYRKQVALEWLGEELPPSVGKAIINISYGVSQSALTWAKDRPDRKFHTVYLSGSVGQDFDALLAHEMVHVVLATRYPHPNRLAPWLEEGIASRYDDQERKATRDRIARWFVKTGAYPGVIRALEADTISPVDQETYAVCATMTELLLSRGTKRTLIEFGESGRSGWDAALVKYYGIENVAELQAAWQGWVAR